jgi:diguanylate cyclase (GGDEF)-like protein
MEELDELTGVMTRSAILNQLDQAVAAAGQENHTLTLIFLDLDHFMRFNEEYGHVVGDMFLNGIMKMFKDTFGQDQLVGRYGGDEFVAAVRGADAATLFERAEELRNQIEKNGPYVTVNNTVHSDWIYCYAGSGNLSRRRRECNQFDRKSSPGHVPGERSRREYGLLLRGERCHYRHLQPVRHHCASWMKRWHLLESSATKSLCCWWTLTNSSRSTMNLVTGPGMRCSSGLHHLYQ